MVSFPKLILLVFCHWQFVSSNSDVPVSPQEKTLTIYVADTSDIDFQQQPDDFNKDGLKLLQRCGNKECDLWMEYCNTVGTAHCISCGNLCRSNRINDDAVKKDCQSKCKGYLYKLQEKLSKEQFNKIVVQSKEDATRKKMDPFAVWAIVASCVAAVFALALVLVVLGLKCKNDKKKKNTAEDTEQPQPNASRTLAADTDQTIPMTNIGPNLRQMPQTAQEENTSNNNVNGNIEDRNVPIMQPESAVNVSARGRAVEHVHSGIVASPSTPDSPRNHNANHMDHAVYSRNTHRTPLPGVTNDEEFASLLANSNGPQSPVPQVASHDQLVTSSSVSGPQQVTLGGTSTQPLLNQQSSVNSSF